MKDILVLGHKTPSLDKILTLDSLAFLVDLERCFGDRRRQLLAARQARQARFDQGERPDFLPQTAAIREGDWTVAPVLPDLQDRRVEITGPVERKMIINALNSGAKVFMADFEDSNTPTWDNQIEGQQNLYDANRRTITYDDPRTNRHYALGATPAVLMVRPRGWHLEERHVLVDGQPMSGALFDFGLYFFHNAKHLVGAGSGPYFYLPKLESHQEAQLWNDVFVRAQGALGIAQGTIKATVLIETLPASFEMDEILHALRAHSAGLNCGRWDYIFSFIKKFSRHLGFVLPDRGTVTMTTPFMRAYSQLVIKTCHRRRTHAMGGMAAQIPIKDDADANALAMERVRADKLREVTDGHDGTWVAHPGLVPLARAVFDEHMPTPNQIDQQRPAIAVTAQDLIAVPQGPKTEAGLRQNVAVGIGYVEAWLRGIGCVPLFHLMEDAATAEISRAQIWQWVHHGVALEDGRTVDRALVHGIIADELGRARERVGERAFHEGRYAQAAELMRELIDSERFIEFLTLPAYQRLPDGVAAAAMGDV